MFTVWSWKVAAAKSDLIIFDGMIHQLFLSDIPYTINTFIELVELVRSKNRNPCLFAMTCWSLWNRRKKVRMNEVVLAMERLFDQVVQLLQEFQNAHPAQPKSVHPVRPPWKSLDPSELKTNFDEAVFDDLNSAGIGVVVRNSQGDIMAALSEQILMPSSVLCWRLWQLEEQFYSSMSLASTVPVLSAIQKCQSMLFATKTWCILPLVTL